MSIRTVGGVVEIKWDGSTWTDESEHFERASGRATHTSRATGWLGVGIGGVARANVIMRNANGRFSLKNTAGPYYSYIGDGKIRNLPIRISATINNSTCVIFTGYIRDHKEDAAQNLVEWLCEDRGTLLNEQHISTSLMRDITTGCYAESILIDAGLSASEYSIDAGYMTIPFAWMDDESIWGELGRIAEVEGGRIYVDRFGVVVFEDSAAMLSGSSL